MSQTKESRDSRPLVFHVIDSLDISGGAERQLVANLKSFDSEIIDHEVVIIKRTATTRENELTGVVSVTALFSEGETISRPRVLARLRKLVRSRRPALMHAALPDAALAARVIGRLERVPVVESLVNISHEMIRITDNPAVTPAKLHFHTMLDRLTMRKVAAFHAVSEAVADSWGDVVGIRRSKIRVIPRGVEIEEIRVSASERISNQESVREEFGFPHEFKLVISVGRLEPQKGHRYLVEAMAQPVFDDASVGVLIVGRSGLASTTVGAAISDLGLDAVVKLTGPRRDIQRLLSAADVFAFPSLFEGNGGNAMIEAMAASLAIVTTDAAPMTDLIPNDRIGMLVPRADPNAIAVAIHDLLINDELRLGLGRRAAERASMFRSPAEIAHEYEAWYQSLLDM